MLENLLNMDRRTRRGSDRDEMARLLAAARRNIQDAHVAGISEPTRFDVAYKAIIQCALAAAMAAGCLPAANERGQAASVIQSLSATIGLPAEQVGVLDALRKKRDFNDYSGEEVSDDTAAVCVRASESLLSNLLLWLIANRPEKL